MSEAVEGLDESLLLSAEEARILGCLIEKESTTPEQYPLTQNAVQLACNQKTSRDPVMELEAGEVGHALRRLEERRLVRSVHGSRAQRYEHRFAEAFGVTRAQQALLGLLLLRGPQTAPELLQRCERLHDFSDADELQHALERLIQRAPTLVVRVPKSGGQREDRYMHLLCGPVDMEHYAQATTSSSTPRRGELEARVDALEQALEELRERLDTLTGG